MKTRPFITSLIAFQVLAALSSQAAIVYSGLKDFTITSDFDGIYLDVDAGALVGTEAVGWDINPFFGGEGIANSPAFQPVRTSSALYAPVVNLTTSQSVGASSVFGSGFGGSGDPVSHVGTSPSQFVSGVEGYLGFKLTTNANAGPYYGWMRVVFSNTGGTGLIRDWAYDNTGGDIAISAVPEISYATLPLICAGSLMLRRRRK
ncbi:MAG: hypothetical protein ACRDBP_03190 [Luteolibacter sp.]